MDVRAALIEALSPVIGSIDATKIAEMNEGNSDFSTMVIRRLVCHKLVHVRQVLEQVRSALHAQYKAAASDFAEAHSAQLDELNRLAAPTRVVVKVEYVLPWNNLDRFIEICRECERTRSE